MRGIGGIGGCLTAALAALALALPGLAPASAETVVQKPEEIVVLELPAEDGHRTAILAYPREGIAVVQVETGQPESEHGRSSGAAVAVRTATGSAADGIHARLGPVGTVSGSIEVAGPGEEEAEGGSQEGCRGKRPLYLDARFSGTIALRAKVGFPRIDASRARAHVYRSYELQCQKGKAHRPSRDPAEPFSYLPRPVQSFTSAENPILISSLHHHYRWIEMAASVDAYRQRFSSFRAEAIEWLRGGVAAVRWAEASRVSPGLIAFGAGAPPRSATLEPPAPFSVRARFARASHSLRGDLAVRLPGGLRVRIGSQASHARVCDLDLRRHTCR